MTLFEVYKQSLKQLQNPDIEEISIRIILCEINSLKSMSDFYIKKDEEIRDLPRFQSLFDRYLKGEPVQYILGKTTFYNNEFVVDKRVLIPRQESEEVVDYAIKKAHQVFGNKTIDVTDVCSGSGIMGISLKKNLNVNKLYFSDISKDALDVCKKNCNNLKVNADFYNGDSLDELIKNNVRIDLLISNPPYILRKEKLDNSVLDYEPHIALFSDEDFSIYKKIIVNLHKVAKETFLAVFEIGTYSRSKLEEIIHKSIPNAEYKFIKDINGKERILSIILK